MKGTWSGPNMYTYLLEGHSILTHAWVQFIRFLVNQSFWQVDKSPGHYLAFVFCCTATIRNLGLLHLINFVWVGPHKSSGKFHTRWGLRAISAWTAEERKDASINECQLLLWKLQRDGATVLHSVQDSQIFLSYLWFSVKFLIQIGRFILHTYDLSLISVILRSHKIWKQFWVALSKLY